MLENDADMNEDNKTNNKDEMKEVDESSRSLSFREKMREYDKYEVRVLTIQNEISLRPYFYIIFWRHGKYTRARNSLWVGKLIE